MALGDKIGSEAVERFERIVDKLPPIIQAAEIQIIGGVHGLLDRFECDLSFRFKINPAKGKSANPAPD